MTGLTVTGDATKTMHHLQNDASNFQNVNPKKQKTGNGPNEHVQLPSDDGGSESSSQSNTTNTTPPQTSQSSSYKANLGLSGMSATKTIEMEDAQMGGDDNWTEVRRTRDFHFVATVPRDFIFGETNMDKINELRQILIMEKIHCTEGPTPIKLKNDDRGYRIAVESQEDLTTLLNLTVDMTNDEGREEKYTMFTRLDNTSQLLLEQERTIEIYGLHPRTDTFRITSSMTRYGIVEKIATRPCRRGVKIIARVVFTNVEDVKKFKEENRKWVYIGRDLARVSTIGGEKVQWELNHIAKLSCLPFGTNALDLQPLLGTNKAEFIIIPKSINRNGRSVINQQEAFVYFSNQEDMEKNMATPIRVGGRETVWGGIDDKRCRECGKEGHIQRECPIYIEQKRTRDHVKAVKEYQKGGLLRVTNQRSYAQIASNSNNTSQRTSVPVPPVATSQQQKTTAEPTPTDEKSVQQTTTNKHLNAMEKKITQLHETIAHLQEEHHKVSQMNTLLMSMVVQMFSQNMGITIPKEQLQAAGLSPEINRNAKKNNNSSSPTTPTLPQTNESLAMIMQLLCNQSQSTRQQHPLPQSSNAQSSKGQSSKQVSKNE
jgi:hypothetical protein